MVVGEDLRNEQAGEHFVAAVRSAERRRAQFEAPLRSHRNRLALVVALVSLLAVSVVRIRDSTMATPRPVRHHLPTDPPIDVTASVALAATTMVVGSSIAGTVTIDNQSGEPLTVGGCGSLFQVVLTSETIAPMVMWSACLHEFTIPEGTSNYPVTVAGTWMGCSEGSAPTPTVSCRPPVGLQPLPPDTYRAVLKTSGTLVQTPPPVTVVVTPS